MSNTNKVSAEEISSSELPVFAMREATQTLPRIPVLLIEDSPSDADLFKKVLERADDADRFEIVHVKRLQKALKILKREEFAVVVLDLNLPDCHGLESLEALRSEMSALPIVVMTGLDDETIGLEAVRRGAQEYIVKGSINGNVLSESLKYAIERHKIVLNLEEQNTQHRYQADHDHLTGLPNRKLLFYHLEHAMAQAVREGKLLATLFLDLDDFKKVNDNYGHHVADELLKAFAARLARSLRSGDVAARIGGDEFILILYDVKKAQAASIAAERILEALSAPYQIGKFTISPTMSVGISIYPQDDVTMEGLVSAADVAMLQAKQLGKNQYCYFSATMNVKAQEMKELETQLVTALARQEFELHYQPEFDIATGKITGVQALVRWNHPELGLVPARHFIPFIEQSGFIISLNNWIMEKAVEQAKLWQKNGYEHLFVSLNVAPPAFRSDQFLHTLSGILKKTKIDPHLIRLEVREKDILENREKNISFLKDVSSLGIQLLLDGFGSGFSSMTQLEKFPIHSIKIDRSIVHKNSEPEYQSMMKAIIELAHGFHLLAVGEGVETKEQLAALQMCRCDRVQGFFLGKPVFAEQMNLFLKAKGTV